VTTNREPDSPYEEKGVVFEKAVVGVSSLFAFDGRPKSSSNTHDEDAQGDGSLSLDGIDDDDEEENDDEEERASENNVPAFSIANDSTIIGAEKRSRVVLGGSP
jgi:hypothetical protein